MKGEKYFGLLNEDVVSVLADGKFPTSDSKRWQKYLDETYNGDRVLAVIEFPMVDIELEAYTASGGEPWEANDNDNEIMLSYFVCIKGIGRSGSFEWESDDWTGDICKVDFSRPNWKSLLEEDMCNALDKYMKRRGLSYTAPNFNYDQKGEQP